MKNFQNEIGKTANKIVSRLGWFGVLALASVVAGCGSGGGDAILGGVGVLPPFQIVAGPSGIIAPGAVCAITGVNIPSVTSTDPTNGNLLATTSTAGVANSGKSITATFSLPMNAATINAASFTVTPSAGSALIPASISYVASTSVATLTTSAALSPATTYTGSISATVTSSKGFNMPCAITWSFTTTPTSSVGLAPVNLATAAPFAIAATAGVTNTPTVPVTHINGNVVLDPLAQCNAVDVDAAGGFGLCGSNASTPTINGIVLSHFYDPGNTRGTIKADLQAAFLSITPPAGPPAAGSLGGATNLPAGTTLGTLSTGQSTFTPGVYQSTTSIMITGDLTLDAQNNPDAVFVFQSSSTIGTAAGAAPPAIPTRILLINGAKASNVWWQAGTSATLGLYSQFQGNILASASITMNTGATSCGRLLAGAFTAGAFVFDSNVVSVPGNPSAPACQ